MVLRNTYTLSALVLRLSFPGIILDMLTELIFGNMFG